MGPELAGSADTSLHLIDNHVDAELFSEISESLAEVGRQEVITTFALDWLNSDGNDFRSLFFAPLLNLSSYISERSGILSQVVLYVVFERVLVPGVLSARPVEGWDVNLVHGLSAGS